MDPNTWATLSLLIGLELVLGIDNILIISILVGKLPAAQQEFARRLGLTVALLARVVALLGVSALQKLTTPVIASLTGKDLILLAGGLFLLYKAVKEIHHVVEKSSDEVKIDTIFATVAGTVTQILLFDLVFSIDSIITAVGLTNHLSVIYVAVLVSFIAVLLFSKPIAEFVQAHAALKILALSFLVVIGVTLFMEGMQVHVPKAYIYLPMGFALGVELLQMRQSVKSRKKQLV
jgi:predicted tellurium resistance membrane protein TerC